MTLLDTFSPVVSPVKRPAPDAKRVAVCIDTRDGPGRRRLRGVAEYAQQYGWRMMLVRRRGRDAAAEVTHLQPDGVLSFITDRFLLEAVDRLSVPMVDTARSNANVAMWVSLDNQEAGRLAAQCLTGLGLTQMGYCGVRGKRISRERGACFAQHLKAMGFESPSLFSQRIAEGESRMALLIDWLKSLPKPVGVLTFDDKLGERVLAACHWAQLSVPDEVAVLGIGNDDLVPMLTWPSLSSINVPSERIGMEAAQMLDCAMRGQSVDQPQRYLTPIGITMRGTTRVLAVLDTVVEFSAQYMREHVSADIGVEHVAAAVGVSRRTLDRRFIAALGRSVHDELTLIRMQKACALLSDSSQAIATIAQACGFGTAASFSRSFHREEGCWPTEYRQRIRG